MKKDAHNAICRNATKQNINEDESIEKKARKSVSKVKWTVCVNQNLSRQIMEIH